MNIWTLRVTSLTTALALGASLGCSSQGCGGTDISASPTGSQAPSVQCGSGTYLNSAYQCVPRPTSTTSAAAAAQGK